MEAVRIYVEKPCGNSRLSFRKFSVDPTLTNLDVLRSILTRAFDIQSEFALCYKKLDSTQREVYLPLTTDWDLEAAFLSASDPQLMLVLNVHDDGCGDGVVTLRRSASATEKLISPPVQNEDTSTLSTQSATLRAPPKAASSSRLSLQGLIRGQVEKTYNNILQGFRNLALSEEDYLSTLSHACPLDDTLFHSYLDQVGTLTKPEELRVTVFQRGGVEPSLRRVVWKHLLNVYPDNLTGRQRLEYIKLKAAEYEDLKKQWQEVANGACKDQDGKEIRLQEEIRVVSNMVCKDVLRTDR